MDPDENLKRQLKLAEAILTRDPPEADRIALAELVVALDQWIRSGGFLPAEWANAPGRTR